MCGITRKFIKSRELVFWVVWDFFQMQSTALKTLVVSKLNTTVSSLSELFYAQYCWRLTHNWVVVVVLWSLDIPIGLVVYSSALWQRVGRMGRSENITCLWLFNSFGPVPVDSGNFSVAVWLQIVKTELKCVGILKEDRFRSPSKIGALRGRWKGKYLLKWKLHFKMSGSSKVT